MMGLYYLPFGYTVSPTVISYAFHPWHVVCCRMKTSELVSLAAMAVTAVMAVMVGLPLAAAKLVSYF